MKANELRLGNWVDDVDRALKIRDHNQLAPWLVKHYNPILLTEELLIKFGFEKLEFNSEKHGYGCEYVLEIEEVDGFRLEYQNDFSIGIMYNKEQLAITPNTDKARYVHQLQNLYFALTGEELEIKD